MAAKRSPRKIRGKTPDADQTPDAEPVQRPARTAADVHDAALTLFAERGYHGTSMKDIATRMRMRAPSLYHHVAAKQDLLREVMIAVHAAFARELRAAIDSSTDVAEQLRRVTEVHARFHTTHAREWKVSSRDLEHLEEPARSQVRAMRRGFEETVIGIIERGAATGRFSVSSPKLTAYAIFRMNAGVAQWYRPGGEFTSSQIGFTFGDLALRMVGAAVAPRPKGPERASLREGGRAPRGRR